MTVKLEIHRRSDYPPDARLIRFVQLKRRYVVTVVFVRCSIVRTDSGNGETWGEDPVMQLARLSIRSRRGLDR